MKITHFLLLISISILYFSCSEDNDVTVSRNLQGYLDENATTQFGNVIACAASADGNTSLTYIFYYPEEGASDIRYYEADISITDQNVFSNYKRQILSETTVFGGKLNRMSRSSSVEGWSIVTYVLDGELQVSNPIRLKSLTRTTEWEEEITIEFPETLTPKFTWTDGTYAENNIYFQVITAVEEAAFISGTYTTEKTFQYYDTSNVVLDINTEMPEKLVEDIEYDFTLMGVSEDNWVNLIIEKPFVPRNLEEYINVNSTRTLDQVNAFAASANGNNSLSYIYYYPEDGARLVRYYETDNTSVDKNDYANYKRRILTDASYFGAKLRRISRSGSEESWCIVVYFTEGKLHLSEPIRLKNQSKPTEWTDDVTINTEENLKPKFTWLDGVYAENATYFQVVTDSDVSFLSGTFTTEKEFQYSVTEGFNTLNTTTPESLILDADYNFTMMGISEDHWVNLYIKETFTAE
ncbi:hypothetical protein BTO04_07240 [Polaribacter sp. SA4-10]|uniref:hypothetical protein n=1 Tax=Polaribacter sp. SA4-10 TaxID=754397 RepID=UPI000B3CAE28|nr:hypothetical protein [Polaribacter sp. SA4-10]ARV06506.1 hypothetical protein BTO04_07240 [Polaribacter sp. SA4-10]